MILVGRFNTKSCADFVTQQSLVVKPCVAWISYSCLAHSGLYACYDSHLSTIPSSVEGGVSGQLCSGVINLSPIGVL